MKTKFQWRLTPDPSALSTAAVTKTKFQWRLTPDPSALSAAAATKTKFQWRLTPDPSALSTAAVTKTSYVETSAYITKDGSEIRELMHPAVHGNRLQSLAEATVAPGTRTQLHRHAITEELYHITAGSGLMTLGDTRIKVGAGDTVLIAPGTPHRIEATGAEPLRILCCCCPPYSHEDTELLEDA